MLLRRLSSAQFLRPGVPFQSIPSRPLSSLDTNAWSYPPSATDVATDEVTQLASSPKRPLTLNDLLRHGCPPLSKEALLSSANFTLSLLPARLAYRIQALRNLPFIVVSNPHVSQIYNNYIHSLSTLLPYQKRKITTSEDEKQFTETMADLVQTHTNTIPVLARGFLECRKYISPEEVTAFLDDHLRARIGTRLIAQQHLALHMASQPTEEGRPPIPSNYIGVIDTALQPARLIRSCEEFVAEICELKYGVRPRVIINGEVDATFAHIPVHLEYIITELLKNAFRAVVESGNEREPVEVTIASAPDVVDKKDEKAPSSMCQFCKPSKGNIDFQAASQPGEVLSNNAFFGSIDSPTQSITIRFRDRGGGIPPEILADIWSYSFTTYSEDEVLNEDNGNIDGLNLLSNTNINNSTIAGLGYGLPLGRAYAEYFGGSIHLQSMWGWGTDVYLTLQGVGKVK
ncbi:mitochondrial pyruvate dehydrogenase kinase [Coccidioides immitis RS]|uniref:Protein-serine/threonine kinase n=2 Tax=Coccidioides immitis TaxID=5501 RepID=J3KET2_COCIM|nr:mitochondrial pyruvate dehydrogenase kinase [Coccidioides immitis RS]EAS34028.3 mitochondrial pyruvate dehydrogenase kinase [Coccidioides immitis RS]KMP05244.1 kinase [Coccidioides immitis RMSCC 2394]TPX21624.1 hypothetical protein DIZ76_015583 [Coccidioides immitis]